MINPVEIQKRLDDLCAEWPEPGTPEWLTASENALALIDQLLDLAHALGKSAAVNADIETAKFVDEKIKGLQGHRGRFVLMMKLERIIRPHQTAGKK